MKDIDRFEDRLWKVCLAFLSAVLTFIVGAQAWYALPEDLRRAAVPQVALRLDPYEMPLDTCPTHWGLRPGYDGGEVVVDTQGFRVNRSYRYGLQNAPWLAIGDSCTFGLGDGWPGALGARLGRVVVNGGVEGYSPRNAVCRLPDYRAISPEVTIVYIGWNAIYADGPKPPRLGAVRLLERASVYFAERRGELPPAYWVPQDIPQYTPSFMDDVEDIVVGMEEAGSEVVLVTLPGLFKTTAKPSPRALKIGHLPPFERNAYVLAAKTEYYNEALRALAARRGLRVLDAALDWPHSEAYFMDSVHLYPEFQTRLGEWMAGRMR